ncbi:uracil-DNA glycosylase [Pseudomonas aeruginosa]|nr:uracil-DNA glycosylase [Pseudomonas aeruginosa]
MKPNCFQCQYFQVTWEQAAPRACRAYGFKSRAIPSMVVKNSSGVDCLKFVPKKKG